MKIMKRIVVILIIFIMLIVVALGGVYIWQKDNIDSLVMSVRMDEEEISKKLETVTEKLNEEMPEVGLVRELTKEETEKIKSGELSAEEMVETLLEEKKADVERKQSGNSNYVSSVNETADVEKNVENDKQNNSNITKPASNTNKINVSKNSTSNSNKSNVNSSSSKTNTNSNSSQSVITGNTQKENIVNKYVAQLYVLEAQFEGELSAFVGKIRSEFYDYPPAERNGLLRDSVIAAHIGELSQLESNCDAKVSTIMSNLTAELQAIGSDTSIVSTLKATYTDKKNLKKAQYMQQYND